MTVTAESTTPALFRPLTLRGVTARNRIWLAPMCQYSCDARDGIPTDWHLVHLGAHASGGYGLVMTEAAAIVPEGRISPQDAGIWNEAQQQQWQRIATFIRAQGAVPAIQLAHAGRKASTYRPFDDHTGSVPAEDGGWVTVSSTDSAFTGYATPRRLDTDEVAAIPAQFAAAAERAMRAGFDAVELHAAHGYLLHQFLSPLVNDRDDRYGGDFAGRTRLLVETVDAVRAVLPDEALLFVSSRRVTGRREAGTSSRPPGSPSNSRSVVSIWWTCRPAAPWPSNRSPSGPATRCPSPGRCARPPALRWLPWG